MHYADGTKAKVGDSVFGQLFNTPGPRAGTLISITPDVETCNALVQYAEVVPVTNELGSDGFPKAPVVPRMAVGGPPRLVRGEQHGGAGPWLHVYACADYCDISKLTKIGP